MGFFDFLSAPAQDPTTQDQQLWKKKKTPPAPESYQGNEALEVAQYDAKEAGDKSKAQNLKTLEGTALENKRSADAQSGLAKDYDRAVTDAHVALKMADNPLRRDGPLSPDTVGAIRLVQRAVQTKAQPIVLADDFERLSQNEEFNQQEKTAFAGAAAMFRRSIKSREAMAVSPHAQRSTPTPEAIENERAKIESLKRQEESARQSLNSLGFTNPQRQAAQNAIFQLAKEREASEKRLSQFPSRDMSPQEQPSAPPLEADIKKNLAGGGRTEESFRLAIVGALKQAEKGAGFEIEDLNANVPFANAFRTLLPVLDPSQKVTMELVDLAIKQKGPQQEPKSDGAAPSPESDATLSELKMKQAERRDLLLSLGRDPSSQNWLSAIVTILLSAAIGSEKALRVMGYASRTNTLKIQLDILNQEINEDIALLRDQRQSEREMKREAARRLQRTEDEMDSWRRQVGMALLNHKLIIERNAKKGNPETALMKKLSAEFSRQMGFAAKFSKAKDDPFVPEGERQDAKNKFNAFIRRAAEIDEQLSELGGDVLEEPSEE